MSNIELDPASKLSGFISNVGALLESDDGFREAFRADPIAACQSRFGAAALPGGGEQVIQGDDGSLVIYFPAIQGFIAFGPDMKPMSDLDWPPADNDELPDAMLELVSAGAGSVQGPQTNSINS